MPPRNPNPPRPPNDSNMIDAAVDQVAGMATDPRTLVAGGQLLTPLVHGAKGNVAGAALTAVEGVFTAEDGKIEVEKLAKRMKVRLSKLKAISPVVKKYIDSLEGMPLEESAKFLTGLAFAPLPGGVLWGGFAAAPVYNFVMGDETQRAFLVMQQEREITAKLASGVRVEQAEVFLLTLNTLSQGAQNRITERLKSLQANKNGITMVMNENKNLFADLANKLDPAGDITSSPLARLTRAVNNGTVLPGDLLVRAQYAGSLPIRDPQPPMPQQHRKNPSAPHNTHFASVDHIDPPHPTPSFPPGNGYGKGGKPKARPANNPF